PDLFEPTQVRCKVFAAPCPGTLRQVEARPPDVHPLAHRPDLDRPLADCFSAMLADGLDRLRQLGARRALRQPAVPPPRGAPERSGGRAADPDGRPGLLHRTRPEADVAYLPGRPVEGHELLEERRSQQIDGLVEQPPAAAKVDAERAELALQ